MKIEYSMYTNEILNITEKSIESIVVLINLV